MRVLAIDPGPVKSGWVLMDGEKPLEWGWDENAAVKVTIRTWPTSVYYEVFDRTKDVATANIASSECHLAVEYPQPRGMPTAKEEMDTLFELGKMAQLWNADRKFHKVSRHDVKMHLCGHVTAKDANIRQAIIDRYGGDSVAIGGKKCQTCKGKGWKGRGRPPCPDCVIERPCPDGEGTCVDGTRIGWEHPPGPLYGVSGHVWSAIAVALTYMENQHER